MSKTTVLVWFDIFDQLVRQEYEERNEKIENLFAEADVVYAFKGGHYQSACERTYSSKVHKMPAYINNDEAVISYAKEREGDEVEVITPIKALATIVGKDVDEIQNIFSAIDDYASGFSESSDGPKAINIADMSEEEIDKKLPSPIANAFKGLNQAIQETSEIANGIIEEYMSACNLDNIDEKQAKEEAEAYIGSDGKIPAAEFICPVNILDRLKNI